MDLGRRKEMMNWMKMWWWFGEIGGGKKREEVKEKWWWFGCWSEVKAACEGAAGVREARG